MKKTCAFALMVLFSIYAGAYSAIAKEKLIISAQFDEMPSEVQNSETFVKQLYVVEKNDFDDKISQRKTTNKPVPLYMYKKLAPSADEQKQNIQLFLTDF